MKAKSIVRSKDYTTVRFDNGRVLRVRVATSWATEHLYVHTVLRNAEGYGTSYDIVIDDPVAIGASTRGQEFEVFKNIHEQVASVDDPWEVLNSLGLTAYVKAITLLYRAQHKEAYANNRSKWVGEREKVTKFVAFPATFAVLKREDAEMLKTGIDDVAALIARAALNGSCFDEAFELMHRHVEQAAECAYYSASNDEEDYEDYEED